MVVPRTFLKFDRPELTDGAFVVRATPDEVRNQRRHSRSTPLGYLYQIRIDGEPDDDVVIPAGHFDDDEMVWVFSGCLSGVGGLTEPYRSDEPQNNQ